MHTRSWFNQVKGLACTLLFILATSGPLSAQRGALTVPRNLAELVAQADTIVRGRVLLARVERHPRLTNLYTVVVTLRVEDTFKGDAKESFEFRQFIWDIRDRYDAAGYRKGQRLLLLMNQPTQYGLSSPVGLQQGRFRIVRDPRGVEYAVNGHNNSGLFRAVTSQLERRRLELGPTLSQKLAKHKTGPLELGDLEKLIQALTGAQ